VLFIDPEIDPGKLDGRRIIAARRGNGVYTTTLRATADKGRQGEDAAAPLAARLDTAVRDRRVTQSTTMGIVNKFDQVTWGRFRHCGHIRNCSY